ncbi:S8 family peptidase [Marininema halotolerans]|uniref:Subtilase family protein n=1 Tax=Marininema halotolerans TaxID=1155944 RepID=A0A1I6RQS2_9BACL|nr:S8 family peptidase [Marininema halotolerans]SFS66986.1 Subtilase family protein [Marininema halotolerans]
MTKPDWLPGTLPMFNRRPRVRKIFHLKGYRSPNFCLREMNRCGGRPVRVLPQLGVVIGEFYGEDGLYSLEGHPDVAYWEPDSRVTITDPYIGEVSENTDRLPWGVKRIDAHKVWRYTKGRNVNVAVIDTGIASDHPAVRDNYKGGINILSPMFTPHDYNGHGTHVAGTIAGRAEDLLGVAPRVNLYAVKAFNRKGSANLSDLLSAINWCIENKMNVVNMSFGMARVSDTLGQAIRTAYQKGLVMVAAAGNQGTSGEIDYPARFSETIGVTATDRGGEIASFSNTGPGVDIAAPGDKVSSAWLNRGTREMSGTSMAVPHVAGTAALLLYLRSELTPDQIRKILMDSTVSISHNSDVGLLNAHRSVQLLARYMGRYVP